VLNELPDSFYGEKLERVEDPGDLTSFFVRPPDHQVLCIEQRTIRIPTHHLVLPSQEQDQRSGSEQLATSKNLDPDFAVVFGINL
jgi:hypothetical protein